LVARYLRNVRAAGVEQILDGEPMGAHLGTARFTLVAGENAILYRAQVQSDDGSNRYEDGIYFDGAALYELSTMGGRPSFQITSHASPEAADRFYYAQLGRVKASIPIFDLSYALGAPSALRAGGRTARVSRTRYNGVESLAVRSEWVVPAGTRSETYHLEPATLRVFAIEAVGHYQKGKLEPIRRVTEVTYGPPTENGLPFPKAVKGWFIMPDGKRHPMTDIEFNEYRRYTPTADELDMEKQFGVKPLPSGPRPSLPGGGPAARVAGWLYAAAGALVLVTAGLVVVARRRRAAAA
jgi:hypothetical protein